MSTYTSKKARLRATLTAQVKSYLATECHALLNEIIGGTSSTVLAESSARLASSRAETLRDLETLATTELARLPLAALPSPLAAEFEGFTADLGRAAALPTPERLRFTESAAPRLAELVGRAGAEFGKVERLATAEALAAGLGDLGYTLIRASGTATSAIEASRGHEKVLAVVKDGGEVTTDWVGLSDGTCLDREAELTAAVARHGVDLGESKASLHHDPRGGQTVASAARRHAESLAHGAVLEAEAPAGRQPARARRDAAAPRRGKARG
jgi:hypothetical protein